METPSMASSGLRGSAQETLLPARAKPAASRCLRETRHDASVTGPDRALRLVAQRFARHRGDGARPPGEAMRLGIGRSGAVPSIAGRARPSQARGVNTFETQSSLGCRAGPVLVARGFRGIGAEPRQQVGRDLVGKQPLGLDVAVAPGPARVVPGVTLQSAWPSWRDT
jgi:hypothetical protein